MDIHREKTTHEVIRHLDGGKSARIQTVEVEDVVQHYSVCQSQKSVVTYVSKKDHIPFDIILKLPPRAAHSIS